MPVGVWCGSWTGKRLMPRLRLWFCWKVLELLRPKTDCLIRCDIRTGTLDKTYEVGKYEFK